MSEIAQILLLPPPPRANTRALAPQTQDDTAVQPAAADQARARRFRFRVHEGGETAEPGAELDTRRAGRPAALAPRNATLDRSSLLNADGQGRDRRPALFGADPGRGASSAFLAQSIAQEQLGEGLHNPPYATASAAYTRTGASLTPRRTAGIDLHA